MLCGELRFGLSVLGGFINALKAKGGAGCGDRPDADMEAAGIEPASEEFGASELHG